MRKATGIVRKIDDLGRVVLPMELRRVLDIADRDPIEIFVDGDEIILKKYQTKNQCLLTGEVSENNISLANGKIILSQSAADIVLKQLQKQVK